MPSRLRSILTVCILALLTLSARAAETAHLVLLHVNDIHGQTQGITVNGKPVGGYARLSTLVQKIRKEEGPDHVLLIHAGDEFSRGDDLTMQSNGAANIALMNQVGFSLMTPGNGEFYGGAANLQKRISEAQFPVLAANVSYRLGGKSFSRNTFATTLQGVRLGFMGLCFLHQEHPSAFVLSVADPVDTARKLAPELRKEADLVIAVDHLGLDADRQLAASVNGIDLIIGGHSHTVLPKGYQVPNPNGQQVLIVQAGDQLRYLGRVDLQLTREDATAPWKLQSAKAQLIPLDSQIPQDPAIKATIARLSESLRVPTTATTRPARQPAAVSAD